MHHTLEISRPKSFVLTQSEPTRKIFRRLIWLYVSKPFHITPVIQSRYRQLAIRSLMTSISSAAASSQITYTAG